MKIKICGLTKVEEAAYLNACSVDYAGMVVFYPKSRRNISIEVASEIMEALDAGIRKVAVTVEPTLQQIRTIEQAGFDCIQIHGHVPVDMIQQIRIPVWKAFNVTDMSDFETYQECRQITGYVFDAHEPGSGKTFDWKLVTDILRDDREFLLAGGINADNVAEAVRMVRPDGIDVSSAVEFPHGGKDPEAIRALVSNARRA